MDHHEQSLYDYLWLELLVFYIYQNSFETSNLEKSKFMNLILTITVFAYRQCMIKLAYWFNGTII